MTKQDLERAEDFSAMMLKNSEYERGPDFLRQARIELGTLRGSKYLSSSFAVPNVEKSEALYRHQRQRENDNFDIEMALLTAQEGVDNGVDGAEEELEEARSNAEVLAWRTIETGRCDKLQRQAKEDRKITDDLSESFDSMIKWIEKRVDKIILKVVRDIQRETTDRSEQLRKVFKALQMLLKGDITTVRSTLKAKLEKMREADSYATARANMELVFYVSDKLEQSVEEYGGVTGLTEQEKVKAFSSKLVAEAFDLHTMRTVLDMLPAASTTWEDAAARVKEILDKKQMEGKDSKLVNLASSSSRTHAVNTAAGPKKDKTKVAKAAKSGGKAAREVAGKNSDKQLGICWSFEQTGTCTRGDKCRFDHVDKRGKIIHVGQRKAKAMMASANGDEMEEEEGDEVNTNEDEEVEDGDDESDKASISSRVSSKLPKGTLTGVSSRKVKFGDGGKGGGGKGKA